MKQINQYQIMDFDVNNISLINQLVDFFHQNFEGIIIKLFNETTGGLEQTSSDELRKKLQQVSEKYTGLDEITLEKDNISIMNVIFHENYCLLNIDEDTKNDLEKKFQIKIELFKQ